MRIYTVSFKAVAVAAAQDLFYLKPAAEKPCKLHAVYLANVGGASDAGDAQEAFDRIEMILLPATVTVGSGGGAKTPNPLIPNDAAAGFTARVNDTTVATTSGTALDLHLDGWNERGWGPIFLPPPEHRLVFQSAGALVVRLTAAPPDSITLSGTAYVEELV
jgi:hypothetical protein